MIDVNKIVNRVISALDLDVCVICESVLVDSRDNVICDDCLKVENDCVKSVFADIFDTDTVDEELWAELYSMDEGKRINVPMCVFDLKRIRKITGK